jgi:hypothetical protein
MPLSVGEFLHNLAKKAGMNPEDEHLKNFLLNGELLKITVPEEVEKGIDNKLISLTDAKNNHPEIKNHYQKQALDGIDKTINELLEEYQVDDEVKTLISGERSTYKRVPLLVNKIKELQEKKANTSGKTDKAEIQKEIDALHLQLKSAKDEVDKAKKEADERVKNVELRYAIDSELNPHKTIYDELDPAIKRQTLKAVLEKELQDNKVRFSIDENGSLTLIKEDGTNFYGDNHQQIAPKAFIEKTLSRHKLLKVSDQSQNGNGVTSQNGPSQPQGGQGGNKNYNKPVSSLVQQSLQDIQTNSQASVMG